MLALQPPVFRVHAADKTAYCYYKCMKTITVKMGEQNINVRVSAVKFAELPAYFNAFYNHDELTMLKLSCSPMPDPDKVEIEDLEKLVEAMNEENERPFGSYLKRQASQKVRAFEALQKVAAVEEKVIAQKIMEMRTEEAQSTSST